MWSGLPGGWGSMLHGRAWRMLPVSRVTAVLQTEL